MIRIFALCFLSFSLLFSNSPAENANFFGFFTLFPPLIAIILSFITRNVVLSLFIGCLSGTFMLSLVNESIFYAIVSSFTTFISKVLQSLTDKANAGIILQMLTIGGVVALITKNGGTKAVAIWFASKAKQAKSSQFVTWALGIFIFFDDYANSFIIGPIVRPLTDKFKVSREKLAFIMDSTAAPIAGIAIISTWIGFELSVISKGYDLIDDTIFSHLNIARENINAFEIFIQTLPYRFYNLFMLIFVFLTIFMGREFGPMLKAELKARKAQLYENYQSQNESLEDKLLEPKDDIRLEPSNALIPLFVLILFSFVGFYFSGYANIEDLSIKAQIDASPLSLFSLRETFSSANTATVLFQASLLASITAIVMSAYKKIFSVKDGIIVWTYGWRMMIITVIILLCAWPLSLTIKELGTSIYLVDLLSDKTPLSLLPAAIFILASLISLSTGTSYGTMGILMPLAIPLSIGVGVFNELHSVQLHHYMIINISAVLTGAVFGDHCSPISDTTILSSMASKCELIAHVKTQAPYAISVCLISIILGYLPVTLGLNVILSLILGILAMILLLRIFGKKVDEF